MLTDQRYPAIKVLDSTEHLSALRLLCHANITTAQAQEHTLLNCPPASTAAPVHSAPIPRCSNLRRDTNNPRNKLTAIIFVQCPALTLSPGCLFKSVAKAALEEPTGNLPDTVRHCVRGRLVWHTPRNEPFARSSPGAAAEDVSGGPGRVACKGTCRFHAREGSSLAPGDALGKTQNYLPKAFGQIGSSPDGHQSGFSLSQANRAGQQTCWAQGPRQPRPVEQHTKTACSGLLSTAPRVASNTEVGQGGHFRMALPNTPCSSQR